MVAYRLARKIPAMPAGIFVAMLEKLERNSQSKLKLPWIEGRGRRSRLGVQRIHVCNIEAIDDTEHINDPSQLHALAKLPRLGNAQVGKNVIGPQTCIPPQIAHKCPVQE